MTKLTYDIYEDADKELEENLEPLIYFEILGLDVEFENNAIDPAKAFMDLRVSLEELNVKDPRIVEHLKSYH
jgi:hypothetical protein